MIFKRFLTPKRKTTQPIEDQDALIRVVQTAEDNAKRLDACRRICRLPELRALAVADVDAGVREIAQARYRKLLCGLEAGAPPLAERIAELVQLDDQRSLEHVATHAAESEARRAAIGRLTHPDALVSCALNDALSTNRTEAVERLEDKQALERVARNIGRKDKSVYRIARRKLKEIAEREAAPARIRSQCEELCEKAERLGRFDNWIQDRALLDLLDRQWAEIEPVAEAHWKARYEDLRKRFLDAYETCRQAHAAQIAAEEMHTANREERERLIGELNVCAELSDEDELVRAMARVQESWEAVAALPDQEQASFMRRYEAAVVAASERLKQLQTRRKANRRMRVLLEKAHEALAQTVPLEHKAIRRLMEDAKPLLANTGTDKEVADAFAKAREELDERMRKQTKHAEKRMEQAEAKLAELSSAVEAGELKHAEPLYQSIEAALELAQASGIARKQIAPVTEGLRALAPHLRELQKWRKWGADQHRESLCQTMEALEGDDIPLAAKALRLQDLQTEWKNLDKSGAPVNQPLWERFHGACERVYSLCKPYLEEQAAQREAARREREALCKRLEDFLDQVDWQRIDWKKAQHAEREMRQTWAALGEVEGRHRRTLEKRFRSALKRLDERLTAERNRNQEHKRDLITKVEALAEAPDLERAIEETKRLQQQWHTTVAARQKEENKLWQRFRAACDAVFERRRQQQEAFAAELTENLKTREALCLEAEALADSDCSAEELTATLREIESRWRDTEALPIPRQASGALNQRWREARVRIQERRCEREEQKRREALQLLEHQAQVCKQLERALESGSLDDVTLESAQVAWKALPSQTDAGLQAAIERRYATALAAAKEGDGKLLSQLEANGKRRAELCLHLEILARVDSPSDLTQDRLAFQVNRLKEHMRAGEKDPLEGAARLLEEWFLCGPAPAAQATALDARFQRVRAALEASERETRAA